MQWATLELERDNLLIKHKEKSETLKSTQFMLSKLENELVKTKQELGEALNQVQTHVLTITVSRPTSTRNRVQN